jgi:hypothetical protein
MQLQLASFSGRWNAIATRLRILTSGAGIPGKPYPCKAINLQPFLIVSLLWLFPLVATPCAPAEDWLASLLKQPGFRLTSGSDSSADTFQFTFEQYFTYENARRSYRVMVERHDDGFAMAVFSDRGTCVGLLLPSSAFLLDCDQPGQFVRITQISTGFEFGMGGSHRGDPVRIASANRPQSISVDFTAVLPAASADWRMNPVSSSATVDLRPEATLLLRKSHGYEYRQFPLAEFSLSDRETPTIRFNGFVIGAEPDLSLRAMGHGDWASVLPLTTQMPGSGDLTKLQAFSSLFLAIVDHDPLHREAGRRLKQAIFPSGMPSDEELVELDEALKTLRTENEEKIPDSAYVTPMQSMTRHVFARLEKVRFGDQVVRTASYDRSRAVNLLHLVYGADRTSELYDTFKHVISDPHRRFRRTYLLAQLARLGVPEPKFCDELAAVPAVANQPAAMALVSGQKLVFGSGTRDDLQRLLGEWDTAVDDFDGDDSFYLAPLLWSGRIEGLETKIKGKLDDDGLGIERRLLYCRLAAASPEGQRLLAEMLPSVQGSPLQPAIVLALHEHMHSIPEKSAARAWAEAAALRVDYEPELRSSSVLLAASLGAKPELFERYLSAAVRPGDPKLLVVLPGLSGYFAWDDGLLPPFQQGLASDSADVRSLCMAALAKTLPSRLDAKTMGTLQLMVKEGMADTDLVAFSCATALLLLQDSGVSVDKQIQALVDRIDTADPKSLAMAVLCFAELSKGRFRPPVATPSIHPRWLEEITLETYAKERAGIGQAAAEWWTSARKDNTQR